MCLCAWVKELPHVHLLSNPSSSYLGLLKKKLFGNHWQCITNQITCTVLVFVYLLVATCMVCCAIVLLTRLENNNKKKGLLKEMGCSTAVGASVPGVGEKCSCDAFLKSASPWWCIWREIKKAEWGCNDSHSGNKPDSYTVKPISNAHCCQWKCAHNKI